MRTLTLDEAATVSANARGSGNRPKLLDPAITRAAVSADPSATSPEVEISLDFETYLILAPSQVKSDVSGFFNIMLENDPNQVGLRASVLASFLQVEENNEQEKRRRFDSITELYDSVRSALSSSIEGFEGVSETVRLQEAMVTSLGSVVSARDRHAFNNAAIQTIRRRSGASGLSESQEELRSWTRVLAEYDGTTT